MKPDVTLVFPNSPFLINPRMFPPLGILYLAALLEKMGFNVQCLDMSFGHVPEEILSDMVGISFTTPQRGEAYQLAKLLRKQGKTLIAGGAHPTHLPLEAAQFFDYIVRGEGEHSLPILLNKLKSGLPSPKIIECHPEVAVLDYLPFPARHLVPIQEYEYTIDGTPATVLMTSRGCPYNCSFCGRLSQNFRFQSALRTLDEIYHVQMHHGFQAFMIFDDVFIASKKRLREMATRLESNDLIFRCFGRADLLTPEVSSLLKKMGVVEVGIGIESGSSEVLNRNFKRTDKKVNSQAIQNLKEVGIRSKAFMIVGLPGETEATVEETRQWLEENHPDDMDVSVFQPMPGSPIFKDPEKWGIKFHYETDRDMWFKGKPGLYHSYASTEGLSSERIVQLREEIEQQFKRKELLR